MVWLESPHRCTSNHTDLPGNHNASCRHKAAEGFSGEILSKSAKHNRNKSETVEPTPEKSPASVVHQWFSNILRTNTPDGQPRPEPPEKRDDGQNPAVQPKPPRQPVRRKSRFQDNPSDTRKALTAIPVSRTFRNPASEPENQVLSPPKNLVESTHRRSISSSTCSRERLSWADVDSRSKQVEGSNCKQHVGRLNGFLKEQRAKLGRISRGESSAKAKIILSGASTSTSSIVAAICYAWLLENKEKKEKEEGEGWWVVVPVINMKRRRMWKQKQAAWLLHHVGIDCSALLFSNEVDLESLLTARQLTILVIGQDVLKTNGEVGSQCTILTDNYCEDAYELLQTPYLKELLLAGILLDTQNLNITDKLSTNRDTEAVQLLLVGSSLNDSYVLFDQLMDEHVDNAFLEAMQQNYGKRSVDTDDENGRPHEQRLSVRKSTSSSYQEINDQTSDLTPSDVKIVKARVVPPKSAKQKPSPAPTPVPTPTPKPAPEPASRGKNKFSIAKWFGFGSK